MTDFPNFSYKAQLVKSQPFRIREAWKGTPCGRSLLMAMLTAHWNAKKLLKNCQKSKNLLPKFQKLGFSFFTIITNIGQEK